MIQYIPPPIVASCNVSIEYLWLVMYIIGMLGICNAETQFMGHAFRSNSKQWQTKKLLMILLMIIFWFLINTSHTIKTRYIKSTSELHDIFVIHGVPENSKKCQQNKGRVEYILYV